MVWLSVDSKRSCSRRRRKKRRRCLPSVVDRPFAASRSLPRPATSREPSRRSGERRPPPAPGLSRSSAAVATIGLVLCSVVAMVVRCEALPLTARQSNGSYSKPVVVVRHSVLPNHSNKTWGFAGTGNDVHWDALWHPQPRQSPHRIGRTRHRHPPYLPWFDDPAQAAGADGFDAPPSTSTAKTGDDGTTTVSENPPAETMLPRKKTLSKSGAKYNLPHRNSASADGQSTQTPRGLRSGDPETTTSVDHSPTDILADTRTDFVLSRRLRKKDLVGNTELDNQTDNIALNPSRSSCLKLDSFAIDLACSSPPTGGTAVDPSTTSTFTFQFCAHLRVADAVVGRTGPPCWRADGATEAECRRCLGGLAERDAEARSMYESFEIVLSKFDCEDPYSTESTCSHCEIAYKHWVCSSTIPHFHGGESIRPCRHYSDMVENRCPYLSPHSQFQYAGEPVFLSMCTHIDSEETNLRSCHYLCQDHSINPQTEDHRHPVDNGEHRSDCNASNVCMLTINEDRTDGELPEATEVALNSKFLEAPPSGEQSRQALEASLGTWTETLDNVSRRADLGVQSRPRTILFSDISSSGDDYGAEFETGFIPSSASKSSCSFSSILCVFLVIGFSDNFLDWFTYG